VNNFCVMIPAFNEARTIGRIVAELKARCRAPVYVIDDGSSDGTAAIAEGAGAIVLRHDANMGKGAAMRDGFMRILSERFDPVLVMDGDGQHETRNVPDFFKVMNETGCDIVIGNRMQDTSSMPYTRKKTNIFMSYMISKVCGQRIPDTQCGFRLIKRKVLEDVKLESSNFEIESEMIIKACRKGFVISSVPIRTVYSGEKSRINPIVDTLRFMAFLRRMKRAKDE